jgi:signal transduction histidine kinase
MNIRFNSLLSRIVWLHVLTIGVAAVAVTLSTYFLLSDSATRFENQTLREHADIVAKYIEARPDGTVAVNLPADLRNFYADAVSGFGLSVVDGTGHVMFSSGSSGPAFLSIDPDAEGESYFQRANQGARYYAANIPERRGNQTVWIQITQNVEHPDVIVDDIVANFLARVSFITLPIMLLLLLFDIAIVRQALKPVRHASDLAQSITPSRIDLRLPTANLPSEILPLVKAINKAFDRLELGFRRQREFTADTAHELRTPLAVLRMRSDAVSDPALAKSFRRDIDAMTRVVNQLLELAELEDSIAELSELVDLRSVCAEVVALVAPVALTQQKQIALTGTEGAVWASGNGNLIFQAVRNVVDNAIAHTAVGTTVEVEVRPDGTVRVLDDGPGIPEDKRELIFRRFWRRDRTGQSIGAGLGLAIVARIVDAHGGAVGVENRSQGGAVFSLKFHLSPELQPTMEAQAKLSGPEPRPTPEFQSVEP